MWRTHLSLEELESRCTFTAPDPAFVKKVMEEYAKALDKIEWQREQDFAEQMKKLPAVVVLAKLTTIPLPPPPTRPLPKKEEPEIKLAVFVGKPAPPTPLIRVAHKEFKDLPPKSLLP
jgi:hypothetical protein